VGWVCRKVGLESSDAAREGLRSPGGDVFVVYLYVYTSQHRVS